MEKVIKQRELPTKTITTVEYISIDGLSFGIESDCIRHDNSCLDWKNTYLKLHRIIPRAYSLPNLKSKLNELEGNGNEWRLSSWKDWCDYNANVYGLKEAIKIIKNKGGN